MKSPQIPFRTTLSAKAWESLKWHSFAPSRAAVTSGTQNATLHSGRLLVTENSQSSRSGLKAMPMFLVVVEQLRKLM